VLECASQARAAAGDDDVMVHGAGAAQALLRAGQLDELELHVVPVLLGQGRRLFDNLPARHVELDLVRRLATAGAEEPRQQVMHLRYRVVRDGGRQADASRTPRVIPHAGTG
jgi:dihydrofolate reductase